jgi:DNA-binding IclR family transcriptional regulator
MDLASPRRPATIQSVDRAATLLKAIAAAREPPTVLELARVCGLNRTTVWRLLTTLERHGLVERDPVAQRYALGYALIGIAAGADQESLVRRARPVLERLAARTRETASLAVPKRLGLVYVDQVEGPQVMSVNWHARSVPLHATSTGKAFLAFLDAAERAALLERGLERYTATTVVDAGALAAELAEVRRDGYSVCAGELEETLFGASAPVLGAAERPVGVVSVWGPEHRLPRARLPEAGRAAVAAAREVERLLP